MRDVIITTVLNGWIVTVGCQRVVFTSKDTMLEELSKYLDDPDRMEKHYSKHSINAKHICIAIVENDDRQATA